MLNNIFSCNFRDLPTEYLTHKFWTQFDRLQRSARQYTHCLRRSGTNVTSCTSILRDHCSGRFGGNWTQMDDCRRGLTSPSGKFQASDNRVNQATIKPAASGNIAHVNDTKQTTLNRMAQMKQQKQQQQKRDDVFRRYSQCLSRQAAMVSPCVSHLQMACQSSDLRVIKTVRAAMFEMDELFRTLPNLRLVHLIRDPRGAVNSRRGYPSFHGIGSGYDVTPEARIYCRDILRDIKARRTLEARWVGCKTLVSYMLVYTHNMVRYVASTKKLL